MASIQVLEPPHLAAFYVYAIKQMSKWRKTTEAINGYAGITQRSKISVQFRFNFVAENSKSPKRFWKRGQIYAKSSVVRLLLWKYAYFGCIYCVPDFRLWKKSKFTIAFRIAGSK